MVESLIKLKIMYIFYDIEHDRFTVKEYHSMIGKIITGNIGQKRFFEAYNVYKETMKDANTKLKVLFEKIKQSEGEIQDAYEKEYEALRKEASELLPPSPRNMKQIRMRVTGHGEQKESIVEPADKLASNLLGRMGY